MASLSLRSKVLVFVILVSASFLGASYLVNRVVIQPEFQKVEQQRATDDLQRCVEAVRNDMDFLSRNAADYGAWDATYKFAVDGNAAYVHENLVAETFANLTIDFLTMVRSDGTIIWSGMKTEAPVLQPAEELAAEVVTALRPRLALTHPDTRFSGVLMTRRGPMLIGAAAITTSDRQAATRGVVLMGRTVTDQTSVGLSERTRVVARIRAAQTAGSVDPVLVDRLRVSGEPWTDASLADTLRTYTILNGLTGAPVLLLQADTPRQVSAGAHAAARAAAMLSVAFGLAIILVMQISLSRMIVMPLMRVTKHAVRVGSEGDLQARLEVDGQDELGVLAREFNRMVERVAESRRVMLDLAHDAGKAEVTASILHNVGNVLNSLNVSANSVSAQLQESEVVTLERAAQMLLQHRDDLARFLTADAHGRNFPAFLAELAAQLRAEQNILRQEVAVLTESIDHLRHIVREEDDQHRRQRLLEPLDPAALVEQALKLAADTEGWERIRIVRDLEAGDPVLLDRHRFLQVVSNLLSNAKHAVRAAERDVPTITVQVARVRDTSGERLQVRVADNGIGIAAENLSRIFAFGFSTRSQGHGIGLHSAANFAREMGGSLVAASEGPGRGAVFTLEVPLAHAEVCA
jgi:two-component system, NtrC family, sensor kinase